jgi:hypothetical protein
MKAAYRRTTNCLRSLQSFKLKTYIQMITKIKALNRFVEWKTAALAALALMCLASTPALAGNNDNDENEVKFDLVRSGAVVNAGVLSNAHGRVKIESVGPVEIMDVKVSGLPPNTDFDFFVIQVPNGPFGLAWYQGDIETNRNGIGHGRFIGRFSIETFIVATGSAPAPLVFKDPPFPDASSNPPTNPVQLYHLGLWFNDPNDASKAGLPNTVTPFNGEHHAGVQVLSTRNFPDDHGPLRDVNP